MSTGFQPSNADATSQSAGIPETRSKELMDAVWRTLVRRDLVFAVPIGGLIAVYYALWSPLSRGSPSRALIIVGNLALLVIYAVLILVAGRRRLAHWFSEVAWLDEGRPPTADELRRLVRLPTRMALEMLVAMLVIAAVTSVQNFFSGGVGAAWLRVLVGLGLVALTMAALTYLLAEAALRPVFGQALPARSDDVRATVGVRMRLLVTWAVGSGIPLLFILAIPLRGRGGRQLSMSVPMEFMAASGLIIGLVTTVAVAHSVADPLAAVRAGLKRVRQGDLDAAVAIDDPGEIGLLQASFNQMVSGLRERRDLEDLFGRHVGEEVARQALEQGVRLGGEVREASALFVDLVGSTSLAREQPPEQVVALLNHFFDAVVAAVTAEGGWVNKFEGDAALCVFGVPVHQADHAQRVLRCARLLRDGILALARSHVGLDAGIGVSSGPMLAGNVGAEHRFEYTVIGDPVNEAARLTDVAKQLPERVAASGAVVMRAGAEAKRWRPSGAVTLRGREVGTAVFVPVASEGHTAH